MNTSDHTSFFQSHASQVLDAEKARRSTNRVGDPVFLPTKILSVITHNDEIYTTESGNVARKLSIHDKRGEIYKGHTAPVTCCTLIPPYFVTGSWDKTIRLHHIQTKKSEVLSGHTDFVKCLIYVENVGLVSGSADRSIRIWSLPLSTTSSSPGTSPTTISTVGVRSARTIPHAHPRGVESLLWTDYLWSGGSEGSLRQWSSSFTCIRTIWLTTSIYSLHAHDESILVGSADGSARQLQISSQSSQFPQDEDYERNGHEDTGDGNGWTEENNFKHPDFVYSVISHGNKCITACRDSNIRIFDLTSGKLEYELRGHFDAITSLAITGNTLISVSLDCTLRKWDLTNLQRYVDDYKRWERGQVKVDVEINDEELAELEELM